MEYEYGAKSQATPNSVGVVTWHESEQEARDLVKFVNDFANVFGGEHGETFLIRRPVGTEEYERVTD
jgi:hypothetical protein